MMTNQENEPRIFEYVRQMYTCIHEMYTYIFTVVTAKIFIHI